MDLKETTFDNLNDAVEFVNKREQEAQAAISLFARNFEEFTGYKPNQPITALDVYRIFNRLSACKSEPKIAIV